jgi:hypothetical protein
MLIVRLYGGDVAASERARALALMADCGDCADLFADLGAIASASAAMPVPSRQRDFTLTEKDAARLRPHRRGWRDALLGAGLRRSLGGSLAALGLAGALMTSAVSIFGGAGTTASNLSATEGGVGAGLPQAADASTHGTSDLAIASAPHASLAPVRIPAESTGGDTTTGGNTGKEASPAPSIEMPAPLSDQRFAAASQGPATLNGVGAGTTKSVPPGAPDQGGMDARLVWLIGFGVLFGLGIAILFAPRALRRRSRATRR